MTVNRTLLFDQHVQAIVYYVVQLYLPACPSSYINTMSDLVDFVLLNSF